MEFLSELFRSFFGMTWELFWGLAMGLVLSSLIRVFVSAETISKPEWI
ncbi:MAG: hypothetical protein GY907_00355 [Bacteroidetes bacterium]|jgi:hypothetical protein|nr:hypothetical protein [Bacteroidota bacterium]